MERAFRILLVEEVREQGLLREIAAWEALRRHLGDHDVLSPFEVQDPVAWLSALERLARLAQEPELGGYFRELVTYVRSSDYEAKCRSALVHAFFGRLGEAAEIAGLARDEDEGKAFAHHVLGLARGADSDRTEARFELWLALEREPFPGARDRIERALAACDQR